jgi:hypothetical protein
MDRTPSLCLLAPGLTWHCSWIEPNVDLVVEEAMKRIADDEAMMVDELRSLRYGFHQRLSSRPTVGKGSNVDPAQASKKNLGKRMNK